MTGRWSPLLTVFGFEIGWLLIWVKELKMGEV